MATPNLNSFQRALDRFKRSLSPHLINQFSICTLKDVQQICHDIQQEHGSDGKLRYMRRLGGFIEAMENLGKVMEVFLNAHNFVCFIWGPVKLLLGIARTYLDSLDKLLDVYSQLGDTIPGLLYYQAAFEKHPSLVDVLELYYSDILVFNQAAIAVFKQPRWKKLFHSSWKTFDSEFKPILSSLTRRRDVLESEKGSANLYGIGKILEELAATRAEQRQRIVIEDLERHRKRVSHIRDKLQAPNYQIDQEISTENRNGTISGSWIMANAAFQKWSNEDASGHDVLYVNGIPGAGKTTLISSVIQQLLNDKLLKRKKCSVVYFYFKNDQTDKRSHNSVLRAILDQLIDQDPNMSDHLFEEISSLGDGALRYTDKLKEVVKGALECYQVSYLVLDGLDECSSNEAVKTIEWFHTLVNVGLDPNLTELRVLFSGQRDGVLDKLLIGHTDIDLDTCGHIDDVRRYCQVFCERIQKKFNLSATERDSISSQVSEKAKGMFLYAHVVLGNLLAQTRRSGLRQEMEPGVFPDGLEKAYERVCERIFKFPSLAERKDATKVLGSVTCAKRPLRWREIQSLFCIDPVNGVVDYEDRLRVTCKELCGALVDLHHMVNNEPGPETIIKIAHQTAREYIMQKKWLDASSENARLTVFCSQYLLSEPFISGLDSDSIENYAMKGYYSFQDYAAKYWFDHLRECAKSEKALAQQQFEEAMEFAHDVFNSYGVSSMIGDYGSKRQHKEICRALLGLPEDSRERDTRFNIELRTRVIRKRIETLQVQSLVPAVREILTNLHGTLQPYKCSKLWCDYFSVGFDLDEDRQRHLNVHELPHSCPFADCFASKFGFATLSQLEQHQKQHHSDSDNRFKFPELAKKPPTLTAAAKKGDVAAVKAFLDAGQNINKPSGTRIKGSPLYVAAYHGHFDVCALLLDRGADVNLRGPQAISTRTALYAAVIFNRLNIARLFVSWPGCDPDIADSWGRTPFCEACALGHLEMVKLLLATGNVQPNSRPKVHPDECNYPNGLIGILTPFGYACIEGHLAVVQYLLQQGHFCARDIRVQVDTLRHRAIFDLLREKIAKTHWNHTRGYSYFNDPLGFRKDSEDWWVVLDEDIPSVVDVDLCHTLQKPTNGLPSVCFSADGKYVATEDFMNAKIYDAITGEKLCTWLRDADGRQYRFGSRICFSSDGKYLATTTPTEIQVWDIATRTTKHVFPTPSSEYIRGLVSPTNGQTIVANWYDGIHVWDIHTYEKTLSITASDFRLRSAVAVSPDGRCVAAKCSGGNLRVWDLETGAIIANLIDPDVSAAEQTTVAFSSSGREIFSSSGRLVKLWHLDDSRSEHLDSAAAYGGRYIKSFHSLANTIKSMAITPDDKWVLSGSEDRCLRFWDPKTGRRQLLLGGFESSVDSIAISPKGGFFATCTWDGDVRIWSYSTPTRSGLIQQDSLPAVIV